MDAAQFCSSTCTQAEARHGRCVVIARRWAGAGGSPGSVFAPTCPTIAYMAAMTQHMQPASAQGTVGTRGDACNFVEVRAWMWVIPYSVFCSACIKQKRWQAELKCFHSKTSPTPPLSKWFCKTCQRQAEAFYHHGQRHTEQARPFRNHTAQNDEPTKAICLTSSTQFQLTLCTSCGASNGAQQTVGRHIAQGAECAARPPPVQAQNCLVRPRTQTSPPKPLQYTFAAKTADRACHKGRQRRPCRAAQTASPTPHTSAPAQRGRQQAHCEVQAQAHASLSTQSNMQPKTQHSAGADTAHKPGRRSSNACRYYSEQAKAHLS